MDAAPHVAAGDPETGLKLIGLAPVLAAADGPSPGLLGFHQPHAVHLQLRCEALTAPSLDFPQLLLS
jgi:hypothetical protein